MTNLVKRAEKEVDANFDYFQKQLPELMQTHSKQFALLHKKKIVEFFDTIRDAAKTGMIQFGKGNFSVQQVADNRVDLGYQTHVFF